MPLEAYVECVEPETEDAPIWRFMCYDRFCTMMETQRLYFCRSDLFAADDQEGLPPMDYIREVCVAMGPGHDADYSLQTLKEDRKGFFVLCWNLFQMETAELWETYAPTGVAICSRYSSLKSLLGSSADRTYLGRVWYSKRPRRYNMLHFITTKRPEYANDQEVRAFVWRPAMSDRNPYPHDTPKGVEHVFDVPGLIEHIVISPKAPPNRLQEVAALVKRLGYSIPVGESELTPYAPLLPDLPTIKRVSNR